MDPLPPIDDAPPPYGTVVLDCDSTLTRIEGIDELGAERPDEVEALTRAAMSGELPLEAVYGRRLELLRPTRAEVEAIGELYVREALPHGRELVAALTSLGKRVVVVSGGLLPAVRVLARTLGIERVHAVGIEHDERGAYAGFEERSPLARAGGKLEVCRALAAEPGAGPLVVIGDGTTDLEASPAAARVIAFGGVVRRERVFAHARVHCEEPDLRALLPLLLAPDELDRLSL